MMLSEKELLESNPRFIQAVTTDDEFTNSCRSLDVRLFDATLTEVPRNGCSARVPAALAQ
jgi:hypothetical protein